ncbi:hypothetical protein LSH36_17g08013 [Paralvinella palmiformis]|uniref:Uncharacterized protein n=1 Tax=Paralvinella palmiformis TaxID=53620 RepID=A0AAD9KC28_9ANNE|nr:hypothetical protein LSH36_17g08013 [Paralvinella palmiformis]
MKTQYGAMSVHQQDRSIDLCYADDRQPPSDEDLLITGLNTEGGCNRPSGILGRRYNLVQLLNGKETKTILKHVSTRWLSLGHAISRLLEQWKPVTDFFKSELDKSKPKKKEHASRSQAKPQQHNSKSTAPTKASQHFDLTSYLFKQVEVAKDTADHNEINKHTQLTPSVGLKPVNKVEKAHQLMANPHVQPYALSMKSLLPVFEIANQALQKYEPVIHILHSILTDKLIH